MKESEAADLLAVASGFDRRVADRLTSRAWMLALNLAGVDYLAAESAIVAHQVGPLSGEYLTVGHVVNAAKIATRRTPALIAADVRSARARGLVGRAWPDSDPIPASVLATLTGLRASDRDAALDELSSGGSTDYGQVGRIA